jgi:imidazolonepropionase-like amidohydrolase
MKHTSLLLFFGLLLAACTQAQETVYPAKPFEGELFLTNAVIHVGNGQVIEKGILHITNNKITAVGSDLSLPADKAKILDVKGSHVYPGLIVAASQLGLVEVPPVRATVDAVEIGDFNPNVRSIVAYNTDSKVINTLRSNGILLAEVYPGGSLLTGSSSVVQLDAWNWEDAAYSMDHGIHFMMPSLLGRRDGVGRGAGRFGPQHQEAADPVKKSMEQIESVKQFFREAKTYFTTTEHPSTNLKFQSVRGLFDRKQKFYIHCDIVKEILAAVDFVKEFGFDVVIVGGRDSWMIPDILKQNNMAVILSQMHELPTMVDDDIAQPYKTPALLQQAGVLFAITDEDGSHRSRNLPFNAGTAAAYGLGKEEALSAITLNAAKVLGIADRTGSLEPGKEANIVVSEGDILDMKSSIITHAFIQGRAIDLTDKHKQLAQRYRMKYGLK